MKILDIIKELEENQQIIDTKVPEKIALNEIYALDVTFNSKKVSKDTVFICKGNSFKEEYLFESIKKGAIAYVAEKDYSKEIEESSSVGEYHNDIVGIIVKDIRISMGIIANKFFQYPWREIPVTAFGGTKGKSTATYILKNIIDKCMGRDKESGVISSIEVFDGTDKTEANLTTPEAIELQRIIRKGVENDVGYFSMEVSSQALKYYRTYGMKFKVGVFLNMGYDHISPLEHKDFEDYFNSKMIMLKQCENLVLNKDSEHIDRILMLAEKNISREKIFTYSITDKTANMYVKDIVLDRIRNKSVFTLVDNIEKREYKNVSLNMLGEFNISNAVSAISAAKILGIRVEEAIKCLDDIIVKGRMNIVIGEEDKVVAIVDYAHNKLSFESLFSLIRKNYSEYKIIAVFGCPGGKAFNRRKELAEVASRCAQKIVLVPEDPNFEDERKISEEICNYIKNDIEIEIFDDRQLGVEKIIKECKKQAEKNGEKTVIAITGKGWETSMKVKGRYEKIKSDMEIVKENM